MFGKSTWTLDRSKLLGKGAYGTVFEGQWRGIPVAVKRVPNNSKKEREARQEESTLLKLSNHLNVAKLFHIDSDEHSKFYVLELCKASLDRLFLKDDDPQKYRGPMPTEIEVIHQLAIGLEYIHQKKIIHRNIKPHNILIWVNQLQTDQVLMKWSGFGLSKQVNERGTCSMSGIKGTLHWFAPEILKLLEVEEVSRSETQQRGTVKSDVFAEGLVFGYFLLEGFHLFGSRMQIETNIIENNPVNLLKIEEDDLRELIEKMLTTNPMNRISSSDVVQQLIQIMAKGRQYPLVNSKDNNTPSLKQIKVDFNKILGSGGYGEVFQGEWNNNQVAVKQIPLSKVKSNQREEEALQMLNHPNVIKLFHTESDSKNRYYAIELCAASLDKLFLTDESAKKYRGPMPSQKDVLLQLATGLEYIHEKKVIHRDITPKNILIWVNPENIKQVLLKWADFGFSKQIVKSETYTVSKVRGAEGWFAPEILKILNDEETSLSEAKQRGTIKSDVFNEGLVFGYYLLKGRHLFGGLPESNIYRDKPVNLDKIEWQSARELIKKMIHPDPKERISSSDVTKELRHIEFDYV